MAESSSHFITDNWFESFSYSNIPPGAKGGYIFIYLFFINPFFQAIDKSHEKKIE